MKRKMRSIIAVLLLSAAVFSILDTASGTGTYAAEISETRIIALDAGHGKHTGGNRCLKSIDPNETREWWLNSRLANYTAEALNAYNCNVIRTDDISGETDVPLLTRAARANEANADIFIAIHHNAGINDGSGGGICVYTKTDPDPMSVKLQEAVYRHTVEQTQLKGNRATPLLSYDWITLSNVSMPAILGEFGFMDSRADTPIILTEKFARECAAGIAEAIVETLGLHAVSVDTIDPWAEAEVSAALERGLVPDSVANSGWQNVTSRLAAADAVVRLIEKASGKTMEQISSEHGWDFDLDGFSDTSCHAVTFLKHAGVVTGVGDNRYDPNGEYNRAQLVTMIGRAAEVFFGAEAQGTNPFTDVPDWAAPYVAYAAENGITQGVGGGRFDSNGVLRNQHTTVLCYRAFNAWV